jgi:mono/diheme cytochrome c family protein
MNKARTNRLLGAGALILALGATLLSGCSWTGKPGESQAPLAKGGSQLWAENCLHCHGSRSPAAYSDGEWDVVMLHMRVRGNLTAKEHKVIVDFLKASN